MYRFCYVEGVAVNAREVNRQTFGELVKEEQEREVARKCPGRKNLLPESFYMEEATNIRRQQGMTDAPRQMVSLWVFRGYVEQDATGRYVKTKKYLARTRGLP